MTGGGSAGSGEKAVARLPPHEVCWGSPGHVFLAGTQDCLHPARCYCEERAESHPPRTLAVSAVPTPFAPAFTGPASSQTGKTKLHQEGFVPTT